MFVSTQPEWMRTDEEPLLVKNISFVCEQLEEKRAGGQIIIRVLKVLETSKTFYDTFGL